MKKLVLISAIILYITPLTAVPVVCVNCSNIVTQFKHLYDSYKQTREMIIQRTTQIKNFANQIDQLRIMAKNIADADISSIKGAYVAIKDVLKLYNTMVDHVKTAQELQQASDQLQQQKAEFEAMDLDKIDNHLYKQKQIQLENSARDLSGLLEKHQIKMEKENDFVDSLVKQASNAEGQKEVSQILAFMSREQIKQMQSVGALLLMSMKQQQMLAFKEQMSEDAKRAIDKKVNQSHPKEDYSPSKQSSEVNL